MSLTYIVCDVFDGSKSMSWARTVLKPEAIALFISGLIFVLGFLWTLGRWICVNLNNSFTQMFTLFEVVSCVLFLN